MKKELSSNSSQYNPNLGFIGKYPVEVSNYLFSTRKMFKSYRHTGPIAERILGEKVQVHYDESQKLTNFLKSRDLTFSKKLPSGKYKEFVVPCTTSVVPLPKSEFNKVELAAQKLMISLRKVLQEIYGNKKVEDSKFIQSLPEDIKKTFIKEIKTSPSYFPQLHHPNMKTYPFLDNVGLDLVLVEDYFDKNKKLPEILRKKEFSKLPGLPFRILELNAGSPSGASNNQNILEGLDKVNPEILNKFDNIMPNDHFNVLGETYKSLGEDWTGREDGVQILLPPGGANGASPEIHQLAAYSGLIYADPDQLYQDDEGYIRLRTIGDHNPIVTAIYSRVNADSALFDLEEKIYCRDQETGEKLYVKDWQKLDSKGEPIDMLDSNGNKIPLYSGYRVPGAIKAITEKKLYMGGLNRLVDNKIILATLTHYAPKFFAKEIEKLGIIDNDFEISPPETLPSKASSVETIVANPDEWVVKAPSLAGGQGVYILKTLPQNTKEEVLKKIQKEPTEYAYQKLVKIARIPVAVKRKNTIRFANLAADIRMWVFYGGGENAVPRLTHNALVRYAPQEKGKMSSIVNTSAGGGYAPFIVVDDTKKKSKNRDFLKQNEIVQHNSELPVFVSAQLVQVSRLTQEFKVSIEKENLSYNYLLMVSSAIKNQLREIVSFLHPEVMEPIYKIIDNLKSKESVKSNEKKIEKIIKDKIRLVKLLHSIESRVDSSIIDGLMSAKALNVQPLEDSYSEEDKILDRLSLQEVIKEAVRNTNDSDLISTLDKVKKVIFELSELVIINNKKIDSQKRFLKEQIDQFRDLCFFHLGNRRENKDFQSLFRVTTDLKDLKYETLYLDDKSHSLIQTASQFERENNLILTESDYISDSLKSARQDWLTVISSAAHLSPEDSDEYIRRKRKEHFANYPELKDYQRIINKKSVCVDDFIKLLPVAPYAKFNIERFARHNDLSIKDIFVTDKLEPNKLSLLSTSALKKLKLSQREYAGECFAKKKHSHGLFSESDIFIWLRKELDPFTLLYTAGHEIIHYHQLKQSMRLEEDALENGGLALAKYLNYYGNFLGSNKRAVDELDFSSNSERTTLYGHIDIAEENKKAPLLMELQKALNTSDKDWNEKLQEYGSHLGIMCPTSVSTKVKALQEVLPALENAKNIQFAKELGLEIDRDIVSSALPLANISQQRIYSTKIFEATRTPKVEWETLRVIASHQLYGVYFQKRETERLDLTLKSEPIVINMGSNYNQTQQ